MSDSEVEHAVRLVLPAVYLDPTTFHLDRGFVARALKSGKPRTTVLNRVETQLVFVGVRPPEFTQRIAPQVAHEAYAFLAARDACEQLIVAWIAVILSKRPPSERYTYGLRGSSILAALFNAVAQVLAWVYRSSGAVLVGLGLKLALERR